MATKPKIKEIQKKTVSLFFEPLVLQFNKRIDLTPDKKYAYLVEVYGEWHGNHYCFCEKYKDESGNRPSDEFVRKFLRIEFISPNNVSLSYIRHTGQWHPVVKNITLQTCLEMINENPTFHPLY